jgi:hypothetical protein
LASRINYTDLGQAGAIGVTESQRLPVCAGHNSQFGESIVANRTAIIELNSSYGPSLQRDVVTVTNSATVVKSGTGEIALSTGATASSIARINSAARIGYIPGYSCEIGIGVRIPVAPTGSQLVRWGILNPQSDEGLYFGADVLGLFAEVNRGGVKITERQQNWNIDKLNGEGPSGLTIDLSDGTIFHIEYTWYGYGQVLFGVVAIVGGTQQFWPCHSFKINGGTSIQTPNLPISVDASNGAGAGVFEVYLGGRQASIIGQNIPNIRVTGQERLPAATSTTTRPLISFRAKIGFEDRTIRLANILDSVTGQNHIMEIYLNATLTGAVFVNPTNKTVAETCLETDISATSQTGGVLIYSSFGLNGTPQRTILNSQNSKLDVPENQIVTLSARTVTGTGTATAFLEMEEEW